VRRQLNRHFHASNWLNHFHVLYFESWIEAIRRAAHDYTTPWFYFDPSDVESLRLLNEYADRVEANRAREASHDQSAPSKVGAPLPRRFSLDFRGNLHPELVQLLVRRLPRYFPHSETYSGRVFEPNASVAELTDRPGAEALSGTFSAYFQKLHATHQMVLVGGGPIAGGAGPCTPNDAHGYPDASSLGCLPLGPSHAFYDHLLRQWMARHGREAACALESDSDVPADACVPFLVPLTRPRDLCDHRRHSLHSYV
jgi:hypothetical protein